MLIEYPAVADGGYTRRWFADDCFDLFVWSTPAGIDSFQLCYDKKRRERAVTWDMKKGFRHDLVDDGESNATRNRSPVLTADGPPAEELVTSFREASRRIDPVLRRFVVEKLVAFVHDR